MKRLMFATAIWMGLCILIGMCTHRCAYGYTYDSHLDPQIFNAWERVPQFCKDVFVGLKNPDVKADIRSALLILEPVVTYENGKPIIIFRIFRYCYVKDNELYAFVLSPEGNYVAEAVEPEVKRQLIRILRLCAGEKEARLWPSINADYAMRLLAAQTAELNASA